MLKNIVHPFFLLFPFLVSAQIISKPIGCYAGTNGTNANVLAHSEVRGVLLTEKWSDIETFPGVYDFTKLNQKINTVKTAGLKYSLAIAGGAFGCPDWLVDSLNINYHNFQYQGQTWRLPLWWDTLCLQRLTNLISQLGNQYASDSMLSHVYVTQMSVNGIEGHLNGIDMNAFAIDGFTNQLWIDAAINTALSFANAFPEKPIVFEVHEINHDTIVPATIINNLYSNTGLCNRIGLAMWWISGKTSYQTDLLNFIENFEGDKYAQVIGRSDQTQRFEDSLYSTVFTQAKQLGIRYIEPWPYEFQYHTYDSLMQDFNAWADANFSSTDTCTSLVVSETKNINTNEISVYPNPFNGFIKVKPDFPYHQLKFSILNSNGQLLHSLVNQTEFGLNHLPEGIYYIVINIDNQQTTKKLIKIK